MIPATLNLYFKQGADYVLAVTILQGDVIRTTADSEPTKILVKPLRETIVTGRYLVFDGIRVKLAETALAGDRELLIESNPIPILKNTSGQVCADLTGCTARAQFRGKLSTATTPNQFTPSFEPDRLTGDLQLSLTNSQTSLVPSNLPIGTVLTDDELQERKRQSNDYDWDLEIEYLDGKVESPLKGLIVVYPEVTLIDS